ncbi:hypothetical protein BT69DRAFT_1358907 [Atractiella rhizophila]|nr:hypothetical protein BT69DRAFT_1358907 [Atractiella rhizophila]
MLTNSLVQTDSSLNHHVSVSSSRPKRTRGSLLKNVSCNEKCELEEKAGVSPITQQMKGIVWERDDGVPILGSRRVRRILLAAVFPEFYTTQEVDALHSLLDEEWTARCQFFGHANPVPDENRLMWGFKAGYFESIRWAGSPSHDPIGLSPWWAGGIISGLLNEMPREFNMHVNVYVQVKVVVNVMTGWGGKIKSQTVVPR